jgi:general secretion pathway protein C
MRLVGTVVSERRPAWSFAAVIDTTGTAKLFRQGMDIDGRELLAIQLNRVVMTPPDGQVCQLGMFDPATQESSSSRPRVAVRRSDKREEKRRSRRSKREGAISSSDLEQGIDRVSDTEYNVDRSLVNKILENQAELMRTARIIPHEQNGRVTGVKLYGIRRNSLLGELGINNGDMLRTINGFDMTSPDKALEAYARLRNADHLTIAVERRGKPLNLDYNIR